MAVETRSTTPAVTLPTVPKSARTLDAEAALRRLTDPSAASQLESIRNGAQQGKKQTAQASVEQARKQLTGLMKAMGSAMMTGNAGMAAWLGKEAGKLARNLGETVKGYAENVGLGEGADRAAAARELGDLRDAARQVFAGTRQITSSAKGVVDRENARAQGAPQHRKDIGKGLADAKVGEETALSAIENALARLRAGTAGTAGVSVTV